MSCALALLLAVAGCNDGDGRASPDGGGLDATTADTGPGPSPDAGVVPPPGTCAAQPTDACAMPGGGGLPFTVSASTAGAADQFSGGSCAMRRDGSLGGAGVGDYGFLYTAPATGRYHITTNGTGFDSVLYVFDGASCDGTQIACNDDIGGGDRNLASEVLVDLTECQTITVVVDGFGADNVGDFTVAITGREAACDDGVDNDGDGLTDEADPDCPSTACDTGGDWNVEWSIMECEMLEIINRNRAAGADCGGDIFGPADAVEMDEVIRVAARLHSQDMGAQNYFEHDSLDGRSFSDRMTNAGFAGPFPWGENISAGYSTAEESMAGLMDSPGHCRNIMNPEYRTVGVGFARTEGSDFGNYWTQDFAGGH